MIKILRDKFRFILLGIGLALLSPTGHAANYPDRPIRLIVGFPPGGGADYVARQTAKNLTEALDRSVVVENKPGANGIIAATQVANSDPDGYTLLLGVTASQSINPSLYSSLGYDSLRDFAPVTEIGYTPLVLVVNPKLPVKSVQDFIKYVKQSTQPVRFASAGNGNITHLAAELFMLSAGVTNMQHVPYKGSSPAITDLLAGRVDAYFDTLPSSMPYIRSGQLRALGVTSARRASALPDLPTIAEQGVAGYEATTWFGVLAPAKTRPDIVQKLYNALRRTFEAPQSRQVMANQGVEVVVDAPDHFAEMLKTDVARWRKVTTDAHIKLN